MRKKEPRRRSELSWIDSRLEQLSKQPVPRIDGEEQLRGVVRRHLEREGRYGIDGFVLDAVNRIIDTYVIELHIEIARRHTADDAELSGLEVQLDKLEAQFGEEEQNKSGEVRELGYNQQAALRVIEDWDTPIPAGADAVEEPGAYRHGNPADTAPRSRRKQLVLYVVLLLAMYADYFAFQQVVERVANSGHVWPLVLGLTATTTYLAHKVGEGFKTAKEARRNIRRAYAAWTLAAVWLAMGIGAFVFRLLAPPPASGDPLNAFVNSGAAATATDSSAGLNAMLLLLLYLVTGAIAINAGFHRPRPEIHQFRWFGSRRRRAEPRLALLRADVAEAAALRRKLTEMRAKRAEQYQDELGRCDAAADRIKAEAEMLARRPGELTWMRRLLRSRMPLNPGRPAAVPAASAHPTEPGHPGTP
ncbi:hypothetical protein Cs7R123_63070 [Catellatospora sp. TT07R-123]|uniref:hypothetical protein n=1 Tax=Catellatospora sp. TT07R-123 TaxID=2733863 RepID=UPI001B284715|nr:hypothetical protein [Catellatospora sp. TT07R-123]GHJ48965.1 hypothetical protein Cs7R123_63070 [Catellatospora sp. TT07R-123]